MSNLTEHAKTELALIDAGYDGMIGKAVLELIEVFSSQDHSSGSAAIVTSLFEKLARYKPLSKLEDKPEFWIEHTMGGEKQFQHKRCSAVFKDKSNGIYWIDGKIFSDDGGKSWWTNRDSRVTLEMPCYLPETIKVYRDNEAAK